MKSNMCRHQSTCPSEEISAPGTRSSKGSLLTQSDVLAGRIERKASKALINEVFPMMRVDEISKIAKEDEIIITFGNEWMQKNVGNPIMRKYYTSSKMRLMAKLKKHLMENVSPPPTAGTSLENYLVPQYFDDVVNAALKCAQQSAHDQEDLHSPSNAIKLSYDLKRVASIKLADAIGSQDDVKRKEAKYFLKLMAIKWSNKLATVTLQANRRVKQSPLPFPEDVKKLGLFLIANIKSFNINDNSYKNFREGVVLTLSRLLSYNRRRCGEMQSMRLDNYASRVTSLSDVSKELMGDLATLEKHLIQSQDCIMVKGKSSERTGKDVPVVVPHEARRLLAYLTDPVNRMSAGINSANPYVFANNRAGVIRAYDALVSVTSNADLAAPHLVRSSNLRKYMATMTQSFDISPQQFQWVLDHLGHTSNVHKQHYLSMSDVIERVEVAKLLIIQDRGLVGKYHGKSLKDITFEDLVTTHPVDGSTADQTEASDNPPMSTEEDVSIPNADLDEDYILDIPEDEAYDMMDDETPVHPKKRRTRKEVGSRHKWTQEEIEEVHNMFRKFIAEHQTPGQDAVVKAMEKSKKRNGHIWKLKRDNIKKKVSWIICSSKRD